MERELNLIVKLLFSRIDAAGFEPQVLTAFERLAIARSVRDTLAPHRVAEEFSGPAARLSTLHAGEQIAVALLRSGFLSHVLSGVQRRAFVNVFTGVELRSPLDQLVTLHELGRSRFTEAASILQDTPDELAKAKYPSLLKEPRPALTGIRRADGEATVANALLVNVGSRLALIEYQPHWHPLGFMSDDGSLRLGKAKSTFWKSSTSPDLSVVSASIRLVATWQWSTFFA
jgi:hypothetical protein